MLAGRSRKAIPPNGGVAGFGSRHKPLDITRRAAELTVKRRERRAPAAAARSRHTLGILPALSLGHTLRLVLRTQPRSVPSPFVCPNSSALICLPRLIRLF